MSGMQGNQAQAQTPQAQTPQAGGDQQKLLQLLQQQLGSAQQSGQMPAMQGQPRQMQGNVGQQFRGMGQQRLGSPSWQPPSLQQAWQGVNNPQQFAQWQAQQQQALRSGQQGLIANHQQGIPAQQAAGQAMRPVIDSGMWDSPGYLG